MSANAKTILTLKNLVAGYGKLAVVHDVSFDVKQGEIVCLIGPNGSGKSTVLKSIFGLTEVLEGSVNFDEKNITRNSPEEIATKGIAYVPQRENVFPNLTVMENLEIGAVALKNHDLVKSEISKIFEFFPNLVELKGRKAKTLSGGQRQMLALGCAVMLRPRLILLDEPTAALAPQVVSDVLNKVKIIRDGGVTVLIVEQNAREALDISDRGVVLVSGKKMFEGRPSEISQNDQVIKLFLGQ